MRVLVAGMGYVGTALGRILEARGDEVIGMARSGARHVADLSDLASLQKLREQVGTCDAVVHCASSGRGGGIERYREVYLSGCRNLIEAFAPERFVYTSSTSVYPQTDGSIVTEATPATPDRETGIVLREAEEVVLGAGGNVLRLAGIYGSGRSVLLLRYLRGESAIDVRDGVPDGRWVNQIHRDDAAAAIAHCLGQDGRQVFNVSDSTPLSQRAIYEELDRRFGKGIPEEAAPDENRKRGWTHKRVSNAKLRGSGWQPRYPGYFDALDGDAELVPSIEALV